MLHWMPVEEGRVAASPLILGGGDSDERVRAVLAAVCYYLSSSPMTSVWPVDVPAE